eukprot:g18260.t1
MPVWLFRCPNCRRHITSVDQAPTEAVSCPACAVDCSVQHFPTAILLTNKDSNQIHGQVRREAKAAKLSRCFRLSNHAFLTAVASILAENNQFKIAWLLPFSTSAVATTSWPWLRAEVATAGRGGHDWSPVGPTTAPPPSLPAHITS